MIIGLIGPANSGKTTIFNALTRSQAAVTPYATGKVEPNLASVEVADERVARLAAMYRPKKVARATVEFIDFAGIAKGSAREGIITSFALGLIKNTDALAMVVRNFPSGAGEPATPLDDVDQMVTELLLSDLIVTERRLEKIEQAYKKGLKDAALEREEKLLRRIREELERSRPISGLDLGVEESRMVKGFHFLTKKPLLVVVNSSEASFGRNDALLAAIAQQYQAIEFAGKFEMELCGLADDEAQAFMEDLGIRESARDRLIRLAYGTVGYISFFTVGADEVRAWNQVNGQTALDAAGVIHSDLARGFIRAECFSYDDLIACGSEKTVREKGRLRLEGKTYAVRDGDILNIRFSV